MLSAGEIPEFTHLLPPLGGRGWVTNTQYLLYIDAMKIIEPDWQTIQKTEDAKL